MTFSHSSGVMSRNLCRMLMPALLISTSTPSISRIASANAASTCIRSVTSAIIASLSCGNSRRICSQPLSSRSSTHTRDPSSKNRSAVAAPIPLAPPVIRTRLSLSPRMKYLAPRLYYPTRILSWRDALRLSCHPERDWYLRASANTNRSRRIPATLTALRRPKGFSPVSSAPDYSECILSCRDALRLYCHPERGLVFARASANTNRSRRIPATLIALRRLKEFSLLSSAPCPHPPCILPAPTCVQRTRQDGVLRQMP